ncbi:MAG TPA: AAA family ATPase [Longimicrobium sp.]|uniref:deoxynucleotide monophosphate kinase family protein n=1 Tax=Longimicrobium sp. TaxID=2029185 RepID=UPI002ED9F3E8
MSAGPQLIALAGVSGSGKDTVGEFLASRHGYVRVAFADPIKHAMMALFGLEREQLWGERRNQADARLGRSPRELYQQFGKACREIDPLVWVRAFRTEVEGRLCKNERVVCTDLRMRPEFDAVREIGGAAWLVTRPGSGAPGMLANDTTETEVARMDEGCFDAVIRNNGSMAELEMRLSAALRRG